MMKNIITFIPVVLLGLQLQAQTILAPSNSDQKAIHHLIALYAAARENSDTAMLHNILRNDIDQLVSTGEWRTGLQAAIDGMQKSSAAKPGTRTLTVNKLRMLTTNCALADCSYTIANADGTTRDMWSSFILVKEGQDWKISAIRNMLPAAN